MHRVREQRIPDVTQMGLTKVRKGLAAIINDPVYSREQKVGAQVLLDDLQDTDKLTKEFEKSCKKRTFNSKVTAN
jgi:hypothetical protein